MTNEAPKGKRPDRDETAIVALGAAVAAAVGLFALGAVRYWPFTIDDAFIVLRYGANLVEHGRYAYNPSGTPVEGVTSITWTLLGAVSHGLGLREPSFVKVVGAALGLATVLVVATQRWGGCGGLDRILVALALAAYQPWVLWSVGGLETPLAGLLALVSAWLTTRGDQRQRTLGAVVGGLGFITRPDLALAWLPALLGPSVRWKSGARAAWRTVIAPAGVAVATVVAVSWWRWRTFDALVPNSALIKAGGPVWDSLVEGGMILSAWAGFQGLGGVLLLAGVATWKGSRPVKAAAAFVWAFVLYVVSTGNPDMGFGYRFYLPVVPLAFALAGEAVGWIRGALGARAAWMARVLVLLPVLTMPWARTQVWEQPDLRFRMQHSLREIAAAEPRQRDFGEFLDKSLPRDATIATSDAGAIAYYARRHTTDLFGLNDRSLAEAIRDFRLARTPAGKREASRRYLEDVMARQPSVFVQTGIPPLIFDDPRFRACYRLAHTEPYWFIEAKSLRLQFFVRVCPPAVEVPGEWRVGAAPQTSGK